ncbi:nose resistant to fluoxetine protein 6-like isoform X2 [Tubulanus polymorphus]|uniref:nose resistant to fluoxetine protein 6-like isoform X2 n=1 Tax=Tubulanus polymorphus TaxID=672921 RepID=UPI003DA27859
MELNSNQLIFVLISMIGLLEMSECVNNMDGIYYTERMNLLMNSADSLNTAEEIDTKFTELSFHEALKQGTIDRLNSGVSASAASIDAGPADDWFFNVSVDCLNDVERMFEGLVNREAWASSMLDATGKPGSGLKYGNINWLGNYDECLNISESVLIDNSTRSKQFEGQYCTSMIGDVAHMNPLNPLQVIIKLGTCLPKTCDSNDTRGLINTALSTVGVNITANFFAWSTCKIPYSEFKYSNTAIAVISVLSVLLVILVAATVLDVLIHLKVDRDTKVAMKIEVNPENGSIVDSESETAPLLAKDLRHKIVQQEKSKGLPIKLLLCFSVYTNLKKLISTQTGSDDLGVVHGVRFFSMTWVILGHTIVFVAFGGGVENPLWFYLTELKDWRFQAIINATVSVDSFFLLSGMLMTYLFMKQLDQVGSPKKINWLMFYFHRFWRLTPAYMLVLMVYVPLGPYFSDGPLYPQTEDGFDPNCKNNWWTNLLYVNNLVHSKQMCMGWAWYLANDMQFYWISPIVLIPFFWHWIAGTVMLFILCMINFISTGVIATQDAAGATLLDGGNSFDDIYIKPWCRVATYAIGMFVGYILYRTKRKVKLHWLVAVLGWCIAAVCCLAPLYGIYYSYNGYPLSQVASSTYQALFRASWAVGLGWVIFACLTGYGGIVNSILSWKALIPLSRLTYCAYLVHPVIMFVVYLSLRRPVYADNLFVIYYFLGHVVMSYMVALVASLAFESPMIGLEKLLLRKPQQQQQQVQQSATMNKSHD